MDYQLKDEVIGDPLEEVDALYDTEEEVVRDAGPDGFGQRLKRLLLLQPLRVCPEFQAEVGDHLLLQPLRQLVPHREARGRLDRVPLQVNHTTTII
jgi:hypothetical protein